MKQLVMLFVGMVVLVSLHAAEMDLGYEADDEATKPSDYARLFVLPPRLCSAAIRGDIDAMRELLADGVSIDTPAQCGITPLMLASCCGNLATVNYLIAPDIPGSQGANVHLATKYEKITALMLACQQGHASVVEVLLAAGANVNAATHIGLTPLMIAAAAGHEAVVNVLLAAGADVFAMTADGETALTVALPHAQWDLVLTLLNAEKMTIGKE